MIVSYFHHPKCFDRDHPWPFKHWISIRLCFVACQGLACKQSLRQLIETVELLEKRGIGFRSLTEAIDTITLKGKLVFHIFASLAKFERGIIRERTKVGLEVARARSKLGGRPPALLQTDLVVVKALLCDPI